MKNTLRLHPQGDRIFDCTLPHHPIGFSWVRLSISTQAHRTQKDMHGYVEILAERPVSFRTVLTIHGYSNHLTALFKLPQLEGTLKLKVEELPPGIEIENVELRFLSKFEAALRILSPKIKKAIQNPKKLLSFTQNLLASLSKGGLKALNHQLSSAALAKQGHDSYLSWIQLFDQVTDEDRRKMTAHLSVMKYSPLISIVMPVYNVEERWLRKALDSVLSQTYQNWELCIADDCSPLPHIKRVLDEYSERDPRINVKYRLENGHISVASNTALEMARGEFVALLDHDDELAESALYCVVEELNRHPDAELIYSDEDKIDPNGIRFEPHFKSDWNPDLFYSFNLVTHLSVFRTQLLKEIGGFRKGYEGSQDYDLVCRVVEKVDPSKIRHLPYILYHWRAIPGSTAFRAKEKDYAADSARRAISDHLVKRGIQAKAGPGFEPLHRVTYSLPAILPTVSIIICTRDRLDLLQMIVDGLFKNTDYPLSQLEIIVVDNQSTDPRTLTYLEEISKKSCVKIIRYNHPFNFSAMNNEAVKSAKGEILAFLNNDLEVISRGWLKEMVSHALRKEIGAVGAKLYYGNDTLQHGGVILGIGGTAGHAHIGFSRYSTGYLGRAVCLQSMSAVTGACMVMRKEVFTSVGGFDEVNLAIAYNDVDLCLKIREKGFRNLWTPYAELYHHESASRGSDQTPTNLPRFQKETAYLKERWADQLKEDPYYNPNLTTERPDFTPAFPPRVQKPWLIS